MDAQAATVSVVIVTYGHAGSIAATLEPLVAQLRDGDELIVVDNASADGTRRGRRGRRARRAGDRDGGQPRLRRGLQPRRGGRVGRAARASSTPTRSSPPGWREAIEAPLADGRGWTAWQALVTAERRRRRQHPRRRRPLHRHRLGGRRRRAGRRAVRRTDEPGFVSGACLAIRRADLRAAGRHARASSSSTTRTSTSRCALRLRGGRLGVEPLRRASTTTTSSTRARRSGAISSATAGRRSSAPTRGRCLRCWLPALLATELALLPVAAARRLAAARSSGAWVDTLRSLPRLLGERRADPGDAHDQRRRVRARRSTPDARLALPGRRGRSRL